VDIYDELTAATASGVYLSGLPVVNDSSTPLSPVCWPLPAFTHSVANSSADFAHETDSYVTYNISGYEGFLFNLYVCYLFIYFQFQSTCCLFVRLDLAEC